MKTGKNLLRSAALALALTLGLAGGACAADVRPVEIDPQQLNLKNGEYRVTITDADRIEESGYFTAKLFLEERFRAEEITGLKKGDTVTAYNRKWTVKELRFEYPHAEEAEVGPLPSIEIYPEEEFYGYIVFRPQADRTYLCVINDWNPVVPVGEVKVTLPLPDRFRYIGYASGEETDPEDQYAFLRRLAEGTEMNAYNTSCYFDGGELIRVKHSDYPGGPEGWE